MPHYALEVVLTRPVRPAELRAAAPSIPLAVNCEATRLMALCSGKTPQRAAHRLRGRLGTRLPIDVITSHYPDRSGQVLLNVVLPRGTQAILRQSAKQAGRTPGQMMEQALNRTLTQHEIEEVDRLSSAVKRLLSGASPAHLLAAVGHVLARTPGAAP